MLFLHMAPVGIGVTSGSTPPPTPMKKQKARPPSPIFNLSIGCSACPRGVGHGASASPLGWGGGRHGTLRGAVARLFPISSHHLAAGKRTQDTGDKRVWDLTLRHPSPTGSRALPAEAASEALPRGRTGWGRGKREGGRDGLGARPEAPAPPALLHLPRLLQFPGPRPEQL